MRITRVLSAAWLTLLAATATLAQADPARYVVTPLGTFGHQSSWGNAINDLGQVTGHAYQGTFASTFTQPDFSSNDGFVASVSGGSLLPRFGDRALRGQGINNAGQIAGYSFDVLGSGITNHAGLIWSPGQGWVNVGSLGGTRTVAYDINNSGAVTGYSRYLPTGSARHAYVGTSGQLTDLGPSNTQVSLGRAINDAGDVAGNYVTGGAPHAAVWQSGTLVDLHQADYQESFAVDINAGGQVVGYFDHLDGDGNLLSARAFVTQNGQTTVFGSAGGKDIMIATGINNSGTVVGIAFSGNEIYNVPFVSDGNQLVDLNTRLDPVSGNGWNIFYVEDINSRGQIVGTGLFNGIEQAVILTPVPEPAVATLWSLGLLGLVVQQARRKARQSTAVA